MSTNQKTWTDGEAITTTESNRVAKIAANMDDRAWEGLFTPGLLQKKIVPLSEETASLNPRLLLAPGVTAGAVKLQPCLLIAGGVSLPNHINMAAKLEASLDAAAFAANSSGSTRYDLVYATLSYAVTATGSRKVKDVATAQVSTQVLSLEKAPQVVLTILANVSSSTPTSGMPADPGDGSAYSFPLCYVSIPNSYTSGTAITQSQITALWSGGWVPPQRTNALRPMSIYGGTASEKPSGGLPSSRWGAGGTFFAHFKLLSGTSAVVLDNSIDWRKRFLAVRNAYLGSAVQLPMDSLVGSVTAISTFTTTHWTGNGSGTALVWTYSGSSVLQLAADPSTGALVLYHTGGALADPTNGDLFALFISPSDQFVAGM